MSEPITFRAVLPDAKNAIQLGGQGDVRIMLDVLVEDGETAIELFKQYRGVQFIVSIVEDDDAEAGDLPDFTM